ncbi:MAG: LysE family translocator [Planctomycetia bacterium]|nr:LysE family translocator [Planctomycetia bacterium]
MFGIEKISLFFLSSLILCLIPGVDMIFILGRTFTSRRWLVPVAAALGITLGLLFHTCVVAFGLGFFLTHSPLAFQIVRTLGGAYLLWLGIQALRAEGSVISVSNGEQDPKQNKTESLATNFIQGLWVNLLNPKVVLFFLSYLPQFVAPNVTSMTIPLLFLGGMFCLIGTCWNLSLILVGSLIRDLLLQKASRMLWMNRIAGTLFVLLALQIFWEVLYQ